MLNIAGQPYSSIVSCRRLAHCSASMVLNTRQLRAFLEYQSIIAIKYTLPEGIFIYVISVDHTWFGYLISLSSRRYGYFWKSPADYTGVRCSRPCRILLLYLLWWLLSVQLPVLFLGSRSPPSASRWSSGARFPFLPADEPPVISCWVAQKGLPSRQLPGSSTGKSDSDELHALRQFPESLTPPVVPKAQPLP